MTTLTVLSATPPKFLPTLTLIVTQEAEISAVPVQFVLPLTRE